MKVYNNRSVSLTIDVLLITILLPLLLLLRFFFLDHWSVHLFQRNQRFQAIEFVDWPVREKLLIALIFPKLSSQTCVASVTQRLLFPGSTVSARNAWDHDALLCHKYEGKKTPCRLWVSLLTQARLISSYWFEQPFVGEHDSYFQVPRSLPGTRGTILPFCVINTKETKNALQIMSLTAYASETNKFILMWAALVVP